MQREVITFSKIVEAWKTGNFDENFLDNLEHYIEIKTKNFENIRIKDVTRWLSQLAIAIEIGCVLAPERFEPWRDYWQKLLLKSWSVDLKEVVVRWKDIQH